MKMKKLATIALAAAVAIGTFGISVPAKAAENSTDYTITIPATLNVANAGWNATDGITAQVKSGDSFDTSKTLTVTAASTNDWALKSGENSVGYNLATAEAAYSESAQPASWDFSAEELNASGGTNKAMGINVEDYTTKNLPSGSYTDTVTFTAKVEDATPPTVLSGALVNGATLKMNNFKYQGINHACTITYNGTGFSVDVSGGFAGWIGKSATVNGSKITVQLTEGRQTCTWVFDAATDHYTHTLSGQGASEYWSNAASFLLNGTNITSQLTKD